MDPEGDHILRFYHVDQQLKWLVFGDAIVSAEWQNWARVGGRVSRVCPAAVTALLGVVRPLLAPTSPVLAPENMCCTNCPAAHGRTVPLRSWVVA
jgi:hypothetical protein